VLDHAMSDPLWRVNEVPGPVPWVDAERIEEQRRRLLDSSFRRLHLNEWTSAEDRLATAEDLGACVTLDGPQAPEPGRRYVLGVDVGLKRDRTAIAVCHAEPLSRREIGVGDVRIGVRVVLDRMQVWQGSRAEPVKLAEVEDWIASASALYNHAPARFDPWQALGSIERLRARGVRCDEFSFTAASVGRLAAVLHLLIKNRSLALPDDRDLLDELAAVRLRETSPGVVRIDHDADGHDDRALAVALAAAALVEKAPPAEHAAAHGDGSPWRDAFASLSGPTHDYDRGVMVGVKYGMRFGCVP
jgi:hypothetical protein